MRVLLVTHEDALATAVRRMLKKEGYAGDIARSAKEGLALGISRLYDAIVIDEQLPVGDALGICRSLRSSQVDTPVLLVGAARSVGDRVQGLDAGADDYLSKPFAFPELLARLRALARRRGTPGSRLRAG